MHIIVHCSHHSRILSYNLSYVLKKHIVSIGIGVNISLMGLFLFVMAPIFGLIIDNTKRYQHGYLFIGNLFNIIEIIITMIIFVALIPLFHLIKWDNANGQKLKIPESENDD